MADEGQDKTHEATPYRRQKALEEGQVAKSQDLTSATLLLVALAVLWYMGGSLTESLGRVAREHLAGEAWVKIQDVAISSHLVKVAWEVGRTLLPILAMIALAGASVNVAQSGLLFLPEKLGMDINRINPLQNSGRIFAVSNLMQLIFGLLKIGLILVVAGWSLWGEKEKMMTLAEISVPEIATYLFTATFWICLKIAVALLILSILDYGYQYWKHEQDLRMSTHELREELKNQQGDPQLIARRKAVQRQLVMNRLSTTVPKADVVVTNPTELAIALAYDPEKMAAPIVVAKGAGVLAQRIRRLALENGVPVVERKALAQALYANVDVNRPVPNEQYAAVAEVVRYVYQLKGKKLPTAQAA